MKAILTIGVAILAGSGLLAEGAESRQLNICMEVASGELALENDGARIMSVIFAGIGVKIRRLRPDRCPTEAIYVSFSNRASANDHPGAIAYALPYEGTHIVVLLDRLKDTAPQASSRLLGYTLAHEITHILEGIVRHSDSGIMKAHWDADDYLKMRQGRLGFAAEDVRLIYRGLEERESRGVALMSGARRK